MLFLLWQWAYLTKHNNMKIKLFPFNKQMKYIWILLFIPVGCLNIYPCFSMCSTTTFSWTGMDDIAICTFYFNCSSYLQDTGLVPQLTVNEYGLNIVELFVLTQSHWTSFVSAHWILQPLNELNNDLSFLWQTLF